MNPKTVLIYIYDSNTVRNILRTGVLSTLTKSPKVGKLVVLVHALKLAEYSKEFAHPKIVFDAYPPSRPSKLEWFSWFLIRQTIPTNNVRIKIDEMLDRAPSMRVPKYLISLFTWTVCHLFVVRKFIRFFLRLPFKTSTFVAYLDKYKPDLVFLPTIFDINDIRLHKLCKERKIPTVGMVKSWDNLLGKDALIIWPNRLVVHSEFIEEQALRLNHFPKDRIFVTGVPQYDIYADPSFPTSREEFFKRYDLDPKKRLIVYACMGSWLVFHEREMVEELAKIVAGNQLGEPAQLLVRLHPAYLSEDKKMKTIPGMVLVRPGKGSFDKNSWRADWEFAVEDTRELVSTMKYADVVIHSGSTISIDAACFDTPIINIAFDPNRTDEKYERSARRFMDKDHYRPIVSSGGVTVVYKQEELVPAIKSYLKDRTLRHEGRMAIVKQQCYVIDGKSATRIGEVIVGAL